MRCVYFDAGALTAWDVLLTEVALRGAAYSKGCGEQLEHKDCG